jgi:hypothetical protein
VGVRPNSRYTLSAYVQGSYVYLGATGTGGGSEPSAWTPGASSYQQLSTTFTTGADTTSVTVYLHGWYGQPAYYGAGRRVGPGARAPYAEGRDMTMRVIPTRDLTPSLR